MKVAIALLIGLILGGVATFALVNQDDPSIPPTSTGPETPEPTSPEPTPSASPTENVELVRGDCTAGDSDVRTYDWPIHGLPAAVERTRNEILVAAVACDYDALERLALDGRPYFSYSFGVEKSPASFWRARERDARRLGRPELGYLGRLVEILQLPHCKERQDDGTGTNTESVYYVWPRVHCSDRKPAHWNDLEGLYSDEEIDRMRSGDIYYGHRAGILADGDWVYFIAGD